ncbi:hypothetical protein DFP94_106138 [Fontibacillus phaseoli]|uniref:Uncharacterized protein n=1 Tax=Fontibacillus phaseoli TaxID=1416533 RepID=A0A369BFY3_9BACL|nr:DUF6809 family protein [Fontibacillus phaseoli]RCX18604.1 hypothetical protein DFP94_106138 [Fontibacillus phaseoli]
MPTLLESLYYGKLIPSESTVPQDPNYCQLSRQISESMDTWKSKLSEKDFEELESLFDLYQQLQGMELAASFAQGFRLGSALVFEVYADRHVRSCESDGD